MSESATLLMAESTATESTATESVATDSNTKLETALGLILSETNTERRWRMAREAQQARVKALHAGTRVQAVTDKAIRASQGYTGKDGYTAWQGVQRDLIAESLDGETVPCLVSKVETVVGKKTTSYRCVATARLMVKGHEILVTGSCSVRDVADPDTLDGATVQVHLRSRAGETRRNGTPFTGFNGETVGVSSTGQRIGMKGQFRASRHGRFAISAT